MCTELPKQCKKCAHSEFFDYDYRCARYHNALCIKVYDFCDGRNFIHNENGMSLYLIKNWINHLSSEELNLPLIVEADNQTFIPLIAVKDYNDSYLNHWRFHVKRDDKNE
jgi:hypothetical protein